MTKIRTKTRSSLGLLALAGVMLSAVSTGFFSSSVQAMEIDFNISAPTASGTVSYGGSGGGLVGSNIEVDNVVGLATPANANIVSTCLNCMLNFTSGNLVNAGGANSTNNGWWRFGSGGTIAITGGLQLQGGTDIPPGSTLLSGTFTSAFVQDLGAQGFQVTFGSFMDTKHADLLAYYGLTPETPFQGALTLIFASVNSGTGSAFTSTSIFGGNVVNAPVPLPAAAWLFGGGAAALAGLARRRGLPRA